MSKPTIIIDRGTFFLGIIGIILIIFNIWRFMFHFRYNLYSFLYLILLICLCNSFFSWLIISNIRLPVKPKPKEPEPLTYKNYWDRR